MLKEILEKYEITKKGRVFNKKTGKEMKTYLNHNGYVMFHFINKDRKSIHIRINRAVAIQYIPNPLNMPEANHIDGNKLNNNDWNLEWNNKHQNMQHAHKNGLMSSRKHEKNPMTKLTQLQVDEIRKKYQPRIHTQSMLAKEYSVGRTTIIEIINHHNWK